MSKAFSKKKHLYTGLRELSLPILFFAALVMMLASGLNSITKTTQAERLKSAEQSLRRAVVQCYALEGQYPKDLDYMEKNYGLVLDREQYVYHYQGIGANLIPQISVFPLGEKSPKTNTQ